MAGMVLNTSELVLRSDFGFISIFAFVQFIHQLTSFLSIAFYEPLMTIYSAKYLGFPLIILNISNWQKLLHCQQWRFDVSVFKIRSSEESTFSNFRTRFYRIKIEDLKAANLTFTKLILYTSNLGYIIFIGEWWENRTLFGNYQGRRYLTDYLTPTGFWVFFQVFDENI